MNTQSLLSKYGGLNNFVNNSNSKIKWLIRLPHEPDNDYFERCISHTRYLLTFKNIGLLVFEAKYQYPIKVDHNLYYPHFTVKIRNNNFD